jgi:hypothetical protein
MFVRRQCSYQARATRVLSVVWEERCSYICASHQYFSVSWLSWVVMYISLQWMSICYQYPLHSNDMSAAIHADDNRSVTCVQEVQVDDFGPCHSEVLASAPNGMNFKRSAVLVLIYRWSLDGCCSNADRLSTSKKTRRHAAWQNGRSWNPSLSISQESCLHWQEGGYFGLICLQVLAKINDGAHLEWVGSQNRD